MGEGQSARRRQLQLRWRSLCGGLWSEGASGVFSVHWRRYQCQEHAGPDPSGIGNEEQAGSHHRMVKDEEGHYVRRRVGGHEGRQVANQRLAHNRHSPATSDPSMASSQEAAIGSESKLSVYNRLAMEWLLLIACIESSPTADFHLAVAHSLLLPSRQRDCWRLSYSSHRQVTAMMDFARR